MAKSVSNQVIGYTALEYLCRDHDACSRSRVYSFLTLKQGRAESVEIVLIRMDRVCVWYPTETPVDREFYLFSRSSTWINVIPKTSAFTQPVPDAVMLLFVGVGKLSDPGILYCRQSCMMVGTAM